MDSYQSCEKCRQCGGVMFMNYDSQNGRIHNYCSRCGRSTDASRQPGRNSKSYTLEVEQHFGYGSMGLVLEDGNICVYSLIKPYNIEIRRAFDIVIRANGIKTTECYMTRWDEDSKQVVAVYGPMPPLYEEWEKTHQSTNV